MNPHKKIFLFVFRKFTLLRIARMKNIFFTFLLGFSRLYAQEQTEFEKIISLQSLMGKSLDSIDFTGVHKNDKPNYKCVFRDDYELSGDYLFAKREISGAWYINADSNRRICSIVVTVKLHSNFRRLAYAYFGNHPDRVSFNGSVVTRRWQTNSLVFWLNTFYDDYFIISDYHTKSF